MAKKKTPPRKKAAAQRKPAAPRKRGAKKKAARKPRTIQVAEDERAEWEQTAAGQPVAAEEPPIADAAPAVELPLATRLKLTHADECEFKGREAQAAKFQWLAAKEEAKEKKAVYMKHLAELECLAARGPNPQATLPFADPDDTGAADGKQAAGEASKPPAADDWKQRPLSVLELPASLAAKLAENSIETLGALKAFWDSGEPLTKFKGIGGEKADRVADAYAEYAKTHQELYGAEFVTTEPEPAAIPADEDPFADEPQIAAPALERPADDLEDELLEGDAPPLAINGPAADLEDELFGDDEDGDDESDQD